MGRGCIICVGKIRAHHWRDACDRYLGLLAHWRPITIIEVRDSKESGTTGAKQEWEQISRKITPHDFPIALDDGGKTMTSPQFAQFLRQCDEAHRKRPTFVIGGPWGLDREALTACPVRLSLSPMTFTHELARALLLEQLYRAESILRGTPYHH